MINLGVDLDGVSNVGPKVRRGIERYLIDGAAAGHAVAMNEVPEDRGTLRKNMFQPEVRDSGEVVYGVADVPYALPIEEGTQPFQPPIQPLLEWSERVTGDKGLGFYVALHKIPTEGIDAQPYLEPASEAQRDWYKSHDPSDYIENELK